MRPHKTSRKRFSRWITAFIATITFSQTAFSQGLQPSLGTSLSGQEFMVGRDLGKPLITINIVNGVRYPGVYHVPSDTDLSSLLSYAGGTPESSDLSEVTIRRSLGKKSSTETIDLLKAIKTNLDLVQLKDQDLVMIEQRVSAERTATWVSLVASIVSVGLSVALIRDMEKR